MANWKTKIELTDLHTAHRQGDMTIGAVAKELARRVEANTYGGYLKNLVARLRKVRSVPSYDSCLRELYDFGDDGHRIWVDTF